MSKIVSLQDLFVGMFAQIAAGDQFTNYESYLAAGSRKIWATFKACDLVAKVLIDTPRMLVRRGGDAKPITISELSPLLIVPNQFETFSEMLYRWVFHLKLTGNAYWVKSEANMDGNRPRSLFALNPKRVKISVNENAGITGYLYTLPSGAQIPFEPNEVIHFKNPHPDNDWYGIGDIEAGEDLFQEFINREVYSRQFWRNGASPSGVLICRTEITDTTLFEEAKRKWQKEYGGTGNAGKTAWLSGDFSYQKLGLSAVEMQDIENSKWTIENIFHQHGVPLSVAGIRDAANFATARVDELIFRRYTVKPLVGLLRDTLQTDLVDGYPGNVELFFALSGLMDLDAVVTNYVPLFDRGAISLNELRVQAGLSKIEDPLFDQHFINAGLVPLELSGLAANGGPTEGAARSIIDRFVSQSIHGNGDRRSIETAGRA